MSRRFVLPAVLFFLSVSGLSAHPHMWIRGTVAPVFGSRGMTAVDITWRFDEFNGSRYIEDYDADGNGVIDAEESATLYIESLSGLYPQEYYLIVDVGGLRGTPLPAVDFRASVDDGQLVYAFRVPLDITIRWEDMDRVGLYLFDPTYFVDFRSDGLTDLMVEWEGRSFAFSVMRQELETEGFGRVSVVGLQSGYRPDADRNRLSFSAWIKDRLASYTRRVVGGGDRAAFWIALGMAVLFGMLHVLGPGHGKVFTLAYFSSRNARLGEGLMLSGLINILDSLSAFLLVGLTYGVLSLTIQNTGAPVGRITRIVAYSAIALIGFVHVIIHIVGHRKGAEAGGRPLRPWMLAFSVGLIPCPVSSALLAYGMAQQTLWFSLILVAAVSVGGMIALSLFRYSGIGVPDGPSSGSRWAPWPS